MCIYVLLEFRNKGTSNTDMKRQESERENEQCSLFKQLFQFLDHPRPTDR